MEKKEFDGTAEEFIEKIKVLSQLEKDIEKYLADLKRLERTAELWKKYGGKNG